MRQTSIQLLREYFATTANHFAFFPMVIMFAATSKPRPITLIGWILLGFLPFFLFIAREILQSFLLQIALLPLFAGLLYVLPIQPENLKFTYLFFAAVYLLISLFKSVKREFGATKCLPPFIPLGLNVILGIIAIYVNHLKFSFYMHFAVIISVLASFLAFYLDQYLSFTIRNEETASNMPKKKIFKSGFSATTTFVGLLSIPLIVTSAFAVPDDFFRNLMHWIRVNLRILIRYIKGLFNEKERDTHIIDGAEMEQLQRLNLVENNTSLFWRVLEVIIFAVVLLVFLYVMYKLILKIYHFITSFEKRKVVLEAEEETEDIDVREDLNVKLKEDEDDKEGLLSPGRRIRHLYRKVALSTPRQPYTLYRMTAREFGQEENLPADMALLYEKARYSSQTCTKEDLKQMQNACRRKKHE